MSGLRSVSKNPFISDGAGYAKSRPSYPPVLVETLAKLCDRRETAVDIGCGTGQLSVLLVSAFEQVIALDLSHSQIESASQHDKVTFRQAPAENTQLDDGTADIITVAQAAHWLDLDSFYIEAKRIARPGCILALISYGVPMLEGRELQERFKQFYWTDIHEYWPEERKHVEDGYSSIAFPFEELGFPNLEIELNWSFEEFASYVDTWSAVKRAKQLGDSVRWNAALREIKAVWGSSEIPKRISWPITCKVAEIIPRLEKAI
jgi:SAM-dependent methyltransferase